MAKVALAGTYERDPNDTRSAHGLERDHRT